MKIKIYAIGHLKETYLKQGINEYLKRLEAYTQVEIVEVDDEGVPNNPSPKDIENVKMSDIDFSGTNLVLSPQIAYNRDLSNSNFNGIFI